MLTYDLHRGKRHLIKNDVWLGENNSLKDKTRNSKISQLAGNIDQN